MSSRFGAFKRFAGAAGSLGLLGAGVAHAQSPQGETDTKKIPGVYIWGNNSNALIAGADQGTTIVQPVRVPYFDNIVLRSLAVSPSAAAAVLKNGNVVQWTSPRNQQVVVKGKDIVDVQSTSTGDQFVGLGKNGSIYCWRPDDESSLRQIKTPKLGWFEKVAHIAVGDDHLAALTSGGRVLTALLRPLDRHEGQMGLASFPSFEPAPEPDTLHIVKLLEDSKIVQIASGSHHVVARLNDGSLMGFGRNAFGQLLLPFAFKTVKVSVPTQVSVSKAGKYSGKFVNVAAGGDVTYLQNDEGQVFVAGNGITAQFGTGSFAHNQSVPLRVQALEELSEYNEAVKKVEKILPNTWSVSATHTFTELSNKQGDWLVWGANHYGQIGNGKKSFVVKPQFVSRIGLTDAVEGNTYVAGSGISACYTKSK